MSKLLADATAGDPIRGTKWTRKTLRKLGKVLEVSHETVRRLLINNLGYSLKGNRKCVSRKQDPDRDRQIRYIARMRRQFLAAKQPVISVDSKKKEQIGNFKTPGRTWRSEPKRVLSTDFPSDAIGKAIPYGIYDIAHNHGFVVVGMSHDTAQFAVNAIRSWWRLRGAKSYKKQSHILIQADAGGSNSARSKLWKWELQQFANETGLTITVIHHPVSASKWNWIEHRVFCNLSANWAGEPLLSFETILKFIRTTTSETGLTCSAILDRRNYKTRQSISKLQLATLQIEPHRILPKWNYTIRPNL